MYHFKVEDPDKLYLTSDSHFNHANICKYCHRPFTSRSEMNDTLINLWNSVVPADGIVVHCGDFMLPHEVGTKEYEKFWKKLNFSVLLHLKGNHDRIECGDYTFEGKKIIVRDMATIEVDGVKIFAQHYPCMTWNGDFHVFGHIHTLEDGTCYGIDGDVTKKLRPTQYDVGVDQNHYTPVSYWQLCDIFRNKAKGE